MKVLVLSHMYPSAFNEVAGIFVHEQVKALIEKGVAVRVVSPTPWSPFPINRLKRKWRKYSQIPYYYKWDRGRFYVPFWSYALSPNCSLPKFIRVMRKAIANRLKRSYESINVLTPKPST